MRKIIQISVPSVTDYGYLPVIAVCDDGSLWGLRMNRWEKMPDIPQDKTSNNVPEMLKRQG